MAKTSTIRSNVDPDGLAYAHQRLREVRAKLRDFTRRCGAGEAVREERDYYVQIVEMWEKYVQGLERKQNE